jgi:hypothetical protein
LIVSKWNDWITISPSRYMPDEELLKNKSFGQFFSTKLAKIVACDSFVIYVEANQQLGEQCQNQPSRLSDPEFAWNEARTRGVNYMTSLRLASPQNQSIYSRALCLYWRLYPCASLPLRQTNRWTAYFMEINLGIPEGAFGNSVPRF